MRRHRLLATTARHQLGRPAADIHHQQILAGKIGRSPHERERRLALAGNDRQRNVELAQARSELCGIFRIAGRRSGHGNQTAHRMIGGIEARQHLEVTAHTGKHAVLGLLRQAPRGVDALPQIGNGVFLRHFAHRAILHIGHKQSACYRPDVQRPIAPVHIGHGSSRDIAVPVCYFTPKIGSSTPEYQVSGSSMSSDTMLPRKSDSF